jgi:glyoxylase-like metal-dependent hydrolase (beta-lactamase superfamily II)
MRLGRFDLQLASDGTFRLDGGAMFGVVPKTLWEKAKTPDAKNRILMGTNCPLVRAGDDLVLIDTGLGDKQDAKFQQIYDFQQGAVRLPESIARLGYDVGDVTHVVLSHLHFDHAGWNARAARDGRLVPTFPKARYWLNRGEVAHARRPSERDRASYDPRNWEPLFEAGVVELFDDAAEPVAGIRAVKAPGHNADMCVVTIDGGEPSARAIFWADLVPTQAHVPLPWIMGYDLYPLQTLDNKKVWLPRAAAEGWLCIFEHDADAPLGRIVEEAPGKLRAEAFAEAAA